MSEINQDQYSFTQEEDDVVTKIRQAWSIDGVIFALREYRAAVESRQSAAVKALVDAATSERNKICCQLEDGKYRDNILCHKCDMNETCAALMEFRKDQP